MVPIGTDAVAAFVRGMFSYCRMTTQGDLLKHSISHALIRAQKLVRDLYYGLSEDERWAVAQATVDELKKDGDQWKLDEELPQGEVHSTPTKYTQ